jgi:hypothetical protein
MATEIYFSIDVETDGRIPGLSSMLSLGAVAITVDKEVLGTFTRNLELLDDAQPEEDTMRFWADNPVAWQQARSATVPPAAVMPEFNAWVLSLAQGAPPVFVGYPAAFDFAWIDHYCVRFAGSNPFGHRGCLDMKTYAWSRMGGRFTSISPRNFPGGWQEPEEHSHVALQDALEQGATFVNMLRSIKGCDKLQQDVSAVSYATSELILELS